MSMAASQGVVGALGEQRHDAVADVLVDDAVVAADHRLHLGQVGVDEAEVLLRRHRFRQRGEIADVGEEDGHFLFDVGAELDVHDARRAQQREELARHELAVGGLGAGQRGAGMFVRPRFALDGLAQGVDLRILGVVLARR